jgi:uncharacterized protein with HEPN domain
MRPDRLLVQDVLEAIDEVIEATPATRDAFDADKFRRSHLLRHIQIIGEAAWRLSPTTKEQHPEVPWKLMAGMRHVLVHDYFEVNWARVYETARHHVPPLKPLIAAILGSLPSEEP